MSQPRYDMAVIGGGLIGLSVAVAACRRGMSVCVLEAETVGRHASSATAGGVRSLNRHPAEIPLARAALPLWRGLRADLGADCGFVESGQVRVAEDQDALQALERRAQRTQALGFKHETMITGHDVQQRIASLAPHVMGALVVDDDGYADPFACLQAYLGCARRLGVRLVEGARVDDICKAGNTLTLNTSSGALRAGTCVNAAGAWGDRLAATAGDQVAMTTAALQMIVTAPVAAFLQPVVGTEGYKLSLKQTAAGALVIGGGFAGRVEHCERGARRGVPNNASAAQNLQNAIRLFPHLSTARVVRSWAGLEGMTADGLPIIGESPSLPGLFHAFGFSAHGFALAPLIGPLVAGLTDGAASNLPIAPFAPSRFADGPDMSARAHMPQEVPAHA